MLTESIQDVKLRAENFGLADQEFIYLIRMKMWIV